MSTRGLPIAIACLVHAAGTFGGLRADDLSERPPAERATGSPAVAARSSALAIPRPADGRRVGDRAVAGLPPALTSRPEPPPGNQAPVVPAPSSNPSTLSLEMVESLALKNNPTIRAAEALVIQQQGLLRQATRYPNPTLGWLQTTPSQMYRGATQGAFISQDFVTAGKLRVAGKAEKTEIEWRSWQLKAQIDRVINDVRIRYYEVEGASQAMAAAAELERLARADLKAVEQLLEAKQASRPDVLQAEIHLNAVQSSLEQSRLRHQAACRQLANVVGVPQLPSTNLSANLEGDIPRLEWDESLRRLLSDSPVLRAQAAEVREAAIEVEFQKRMVMPNISTQVVIQHDYVRGFNQVSTLVSAPIPFFNRNRGNIINAEGLLIQQEQEYQRVKLALSDQLTASFQEYLGSRNQVEHLRKILPRTQENLELTRQAFQSGQAGYDFMRVLDAEQTYFQTKTSYIDSLTNVHKMAIEIVGLELTGGLNPTEVGTALQGTGQRTGVRNVLLQQAQEQNAGANRLLPGAIQSTLGGIP